MALQKETLKKMQAVYDMLSLAQEQKRPIPLDEIGAMKERFEEIIRTESATTKIGRLDLFKFADKGNPWCEALDGIYYDPEGFKVASDNKTVVAIKSDIPEELSGKILMRDGSFCKSEKYPNWRRVVPKDESKHEFVEFMSKADRITKFLDEEKARVKLSNKDEFNVVCISGMYFKVKYLVKIMTAMKEIGADGMYLPKDRGPMASYAKTDKGLALLMPCIKGYDYDHILDLDK